MSPVFSCETNWVGGLTPVCDSLLFLQPPYLLLLFSPAEQPAFLSWLPGTLTRPLSFFLSFLLWAPLAQAHFPPFPAFSICSSYPSPSFPENGVSKPFLLLYVSSRWAVQTALSVAGGSESRFSSKYLRCFFFKKRQQPPLGESVRVYFFS